MEVYFHNKVRKECRSIIKNKGIYTYTTSGKLIGQIIVSRDEAFKLNNRSESLDAVASAFNKTSDEIYVDFESTLMYGTTTDKLYHLNVFEVQNQNDLPFGVFELKYSPHTGNYLRDYKSEMNALTLISTHNLKEKVLTFFNEQDGDRKKKMGMLLYGPPGNGKTTDIMSLFDIAVAEKIRIFVVDKRSDLGDLNSMKSMLEGDRTIFILEELTQRENGEELLTFLDGENSWKNSVVIATTNYPEQLPENLVDRPGRFEQFFEYKNPTNDQIHELAKSFGFTDVDRQTHAVSEFKRAGQDLFGQDLSFDYVSFILSSAKKAGISLKEARQIESDKRARLSATFKGKIGFGN